MTCPCTALSDTFKSVALILCAHLPCFDSRRIVSRLGSMGFKTPSPSQSGLLHYHEFTGSKLIGHILPDWCMAYSCMEETCSTQVDQS